MGLNVHFQFHITVCYVKLGADAFYNFSTGWQDTRTINDMHTTSYSFLDDESWDRFKVTTYLDKKFGTLVYDVDTVFSYSSWPYEEGYTRKSADFSILAQDTLKAGFTGEDLTYDIWVKNTTPVSLADAPQELTYSAETVNFNIDAAVHPSEQIIAIGDSALFTVTLSGSAAGTYDGLLRIGMQHPNGSDTEYEDLKLTADVVEPQMELSAVCEYSTFDVRPDTDPKEHQFEIVLTNLSEVSAEFETGVLQSSAGVNTQLGSFPNPVASGDSRTLYVNLTYTSTVSYPKEAVVWVKIAGNDDSYQEITLSIRADGTRIFEQGDKKFGSLEVPGLFVYNNPVSLSLGKAEFRVKAPAASQVKIVIYDCMGNVLFKKVVSTDRDGSTERISWNLDNLSGQKIGAGTYLIRAAAYNNRTSEVYRYRAKIGVAK